MPKNDSSGSVTTLHAQQSENITPVPFTAIQQEEIPEDEIDLMQIFSVLWRGKFFIIFFLSAAIAFGALYAFRIATPTYEAKSVILLDTRQKTVTELENIVSGMTGDTSEVNSEIEILRSRVLLGRVVDRIGLQDDPEFNAALRPETWLAHWKNQLINNIHLFSKNQTSNKDQPLDDNGGPGARDDVVSVLFSKVQISNIRNSFVFEVKVSSTSPQKAALVANTIASEYVEGQLRVKYEATEQATTWLSNRVADLQIELERSAQKASGFRSSTRLISEENLQANERQLKELRARIASLQETRVRQGSRVERLLRAKTIEEKISAAEDTRLTALGDGLSLDAPGDEEFSNLFAELTQAARNDLQWTLRQIDSLMLSKQDLELQIERQSDDLIALQQLEREVHATRLLYEHFLARLKETLAQKGIQQPDSRVISYAITPKQPVSPRKLFIVALSAVLGFLIGVIIVLLREARDQSFKTAGELETFTKHAVLGQIPEIPVRKRTQVLHHILQRPTSAAAEAVRNLRTSVLMSNIDKPPKVILMTSALSGEGKTTTSIMLAHNFAQMGKSVLLIDGDLRRRTLRNYLTEAEPGSLVSAIVGTKSLKEVVQSTTELGFDCLLAEESMVNPADLFISQKFEKLIEDARQIYDLIIIDSAPLLLAPDGQILAKYADATLLGVRWNMTSRAQVAEALRLIHNAKQRVTGISLNMVSPRGMQRYGYGGRYGAYAGYGSEYYEK